MNWRWLIVLLALPAQAFGGVQTHDAEQLAAALSAGPPCCVIDARSVARRLKQPLPDALAYRKRMKINPTAAVAVIGDTDADAMRAAEDLARTNNAPQVFVVKGGLRTWQAVTAARQTVREGERLFVIPKNTCEQEAPLQTLRAAPPAASK